MTARIDVTALAAHSKQTETKFFHSFQYVLSKGFNSREDDRMAYLWQTEIVEVADDLWHDCRISEYGSERDPVQEHKQIDIEETENHPLSHSNVIKST